jgi:hypothetical protein
VFNRAAGASTDQSCFRIALCMSGAISAGAYTAGVVDFLIQALAEREVFRRRSGDAAGHDVRIVAMTGASAGGMTTAMTAVALAHGLDYGDDGSLVLHRQTTDTEGIIECVMPRLYDAWVTRPGMVTPAGMPSLLSLEDIEDRQATVTSALNGKVLEDIVAAVLVPSDPPASKQTHDFLAAPLHLYLTHTNLRGIPYEVSFPQDDYRMLDHADRRHFIVRGLGKEGGASTWAKGDPGLELDGACQPKLSPREDWDRLGLAALATGAFPVGLAPRVIYDLPSGYDGRQWPAPSRHSSAIKPDFPPRFPSPPEVEFGFVNVDGGLINNDPFEFARYCLLDNWDTDTPHNQRKPSLATQAVIMISPFPEGYSFPAVDPLDRGLVGILKTLLPTLIQQARFKPSELAAAADPEVASRWLIAPRLKAVDVPSSANISCGALGGFGGFLSLKFRQHDFQLGRRNCQQFLKEAFALPEDNAITFSGDVKRNTAGQYPIIPLHKSAEQEVPLIVPWPKMSPAELDDVMDRIGKRADAIVPLLLRQEIGGVVWRAILRIAWWIKRGAVNSLIRKIIVKNLKSRNQF